MIAFTPKYTVIRDKDKFGFTFFCELSGEGYTTWINCGEGEEKALELAREEARPYFNRCMKCHRWICDTAYNEDEMMCLSCAPR